MGTTGTFRIRMITSWTGKVDDVERTVRAGEEIDVDIDTFRALVFQHGKAEAVTVEEIVKKAKEPPKKKPKRRTASRTKGRRTPEKDKMVRTSKQKDAGE